MEIIQLRNAKQVVHLDLNKQILRFVSKHAQLKTQMVMLNMVILLLHFAKLPVQLVLMRIIKQIENVLLHALLLLHKLMD